MSKKARPEILALITARGGSKGIPRKNLVQVAGKPLIAHSIITARLVKSITRTIISTDDAEIAAVAKDWGAEVPFMRPAEYAQDSSPDIDVLRHALEWLKTHEIYEPELLVHLRPTGPVRRASKIEEAIDRMLSDPEASALRSVQLPLQSPHKMWRVRPDGYLEQLVYEEDIPESHSMPRQILPTVYWQNGYVDIVRPATILQGNSICGQKVKAFIIDEEYFEIDYIETLPLVEDALLRMERGEEVRRERGAGRRYPH